MKRINFASGAPLEEKVGYSRMVKLGDYLAVGGTTSVQPDGTVYGENDAYAQTKYVLEKQVHLLEKAGASAKDVFRIKIYTLYQTNCLFLRRLPIKRKSPHK